MQGILPQEVGVGRITKRAEGFEMSLVSGGRLPWYGLVAARQVQWAALCRPAPHAAVMAWAMLKSGP